MINFQYLHIFESLFPGLSLTDAAVAYWVFTAQQVAGEAVMHENRRYIVITAGMIRTGIPMMKGVTDRTVRAILARLTEAGVLERTRARKAGTAYAYLASDRFVMSLNIKPEHFAHAKLSDRENLGKAQAEENFRLQVEKNAHDNLLQYINNSVNTQAAKNFRLRAAENLPDTSSHSPQSSSKKPTASKAIDDAFERFWAAYPKHRNKASAKRRFAKLKLHKEIDALLTAVKNYCADEGVRRNLMEGHTEYVKNPDTFLSTRGVEYWRDWVAGGATINVRALEGANDGGQANGGDPEVEDFVARMERAFAVLEERMGRGMALEEAIGEFFTREQMRAIVSHQRVHPFENEEYTKWEYARFIVDQMRQRRAS